MLDVVKVIDILLKMSLLILALSSFQLFYVSNLCIREHINALMSIAALNNGTFMRNATIINDTFMRNATIINDTLMRNGTLINDTLGSNATLYDTIVNNATLFNDTLMRNGSLYNDTACTRLTFGENGESWVKCFYILVFVTTFICFPLVVAFHHTLEFIGIIEAAEMEGAEALAKESMEVWEPLSAEYVAGKKAFDKNNNDNDEVNQNDETAPLKKPDDHVEDLIELTEFCNNETDGDSDVDETAFISTLDSIDEMGESDIGDEETDDFIYKYAPNENDGTIEVNYYPDCDENTKV